MIMCNIYSVSTQYINNNYTYIYTSDISFLIE